MFHLNKIAPAYLENILMTHPCVREAAVIGEPAGIYGEVPRAYVIPSSPVSKETLINYVNGKILHKHS